MTRKTPQIPNVTAGEHAQAVGVNYGTVLQQYFRGEFRRLRDATIDLDPLPGDMRLVDPADPDNPLGFFSGREWLIKRIDDFIAECVARRIGGYVLVEAEAGMGKSALATRLAFTRPWPTHVTRLPGGTSPEGARANLVAQVIARWKLSDATQNGVLPAGHDTTAWLYQQLCAAARSRNELEPGEPVVLLVDGLDEAPPAAPPQLPLGLPERLPPGTVVVATTRPGTRLPAGIRVERIDVESPLNQDDLLAYLRRITNDDPQVAQALATAGMNQERFCRTLLDRSGGVWIYATSLLDQIRDQRRSPAEVDALPPGLAGYYANNLARWQNDSALAWDDVALPLLATLAAVQEPQWAATLAHWAGLELGAAKNLLRGPFNAFLAVREGGDPHVYALRHQSLRDLLEGRLPAACTDDAQLQCLAHDLGVATQAAHARILAALLPRGDSGSRDRSAADDYTESHLVEHAALSGRLDELVLDPEFLFVTRVPQLQRHVQTTAGTAAVAALDLASKSWSKEHDDRLRWLEVSARKSRCAPLAEAVQARLDAPWRCRAAFWSGNGHRELRGRTSPVCAVVAVPLSDGTTPLAFTGEDRRVRLWDPLTGTSRGELIGDADWMWATTPVSLPDDRTLLAYASYDRRVRLWDPLTDTVDRELRGHTGWVCAVAAVPLSDGTTLLASAATDETVRLWDPLTGTSRGQLTGSTGWVQAVTAMALSDGTTLLACAATDETVRLWDPETGASRGELRGHTGSVRAVAAVALSDGTTLLASAGDDGAVLVWEPRRGGAERRGG